MVTRLSTISNWLGLTSLRARYLTAAISVSIVLLVAAYFGWRYVDQISQEQILHISHRTEASDALSDVSVQIHTIETSLQRFITIPSNENQRRIDRSVELFDSATRTLQNNNWIKNDPALTDLLSALSRDHHKLSEVIQVLIDARTDETKWFPAMYIIQEKMLNQNIQFKTTIDFLILESEEELSNSKNITLYKLLNEIRHSWIQMISEFRLFVANSFGVFSNDPAGGMQARIQNIELYINRLNTLLDQLEKMKKAGRLDSFSLPSIERMSHWHTEWKASYVAVTGSLRDRHVRQDLVILRNQVMPVIRGIKQRTSSLQLELGVASAKNITELTTLAINLSDFVIILAVSLSIIGLIGYILFHRTILKPIHNFASALQNQAEGKYTDLSKSMASQAEEFKNLSLAYEDMQEQIATRQSHLDHMAHHDSLTELPNRTLLHDRLEQAIVRAKRNHKVIGLMFLDLDRFKQINDSLGHDIGDQLLIEVSKRLHNCVRNSDTVSRLGGDEFAILVEGVQHEENIASLASKILNAIIQPFHIHGNELHTSTSIGITLSDAHNSNVDSLIKEADIAMYHAKDLGRNNFKFYSSELASRVAEHMALEIQLRHALDQHEFKVLYQPIVSLETGKIISVEALLRWKHPDKGTIPPAKFLSIIEDSGLIRPVTQWVLTEANRQYQQFKLAGYADVRVGVNLSGVLLRHDSILDIIINALENAKLDPKGLIMEITEDTLLEDLQGSEKALKTLKDMGMLISLDDFGTGQSSLSHLRLNPIDIVKIDREFIRDIPQDDNDSELVDAVIAMAHKLHMKVVAEGVETKEQLEFLRWHKCDSIQGYYFSEAREGLEVLQMLKNEKCISQL